MTGIKMLSKPTTLPVLKSFPPKPKRTNDPAVIVIKENKILLPKPAAESYEVDYSDSWDISAEGIPFNDFELNTPTMDDYLIPTTVDTDPERLSDIADIQDTPDTLELDPQPIPSPSLLPQHVASNVDDAWSAASFNQCVSPAEVEGREVEGGEVVAEYVFQLPENGEEGPGLLMSCEDNDVVNRSLEESGIDLTSFLSSTPMWPQDIPDPIPSTDMFVQQVPIVEEKPGIDMTTINLSDIETMRTTINISEIETDGPTTSVIDDAAEIDTKDDPTWHPSNEDWNRPSTSKMVYAKKSVIHAVRNGSGTIKRKPGRPERKTPYTIATVPSKNDIEAIMMSKPELDTQKYRRMRDLNNKASKDCRARRKNKQQDMELEVDDLQARNQELREKLQAMETEVALYRKATSYQ